MKVITFYERGSSSCAELLTPDSQAEVSRCEALVRGYFGQQQQLRECFYGIFIFQGCIVHLTFAPEKMPDWLERGDFGALSQKLEAHVRQWFKEIKQETER